MNLGHLCQIILKSDKEISGYGQLVQHVIFAHQMVRQTPLIALPRCASLGRTEKIGVVALLESQKFDNKIRQN